MKTAILFLVVATPLAFCQNAAIASALRDDAKQLNTIMTNLHSLDDRAGGYSSVAHAQFESDMAKLTAKIKADRASALIILKFRATAEDNDIAATIAEPIRSVPHMKHYAVARYLNRLADQVEGK